MGPVSVVLEGSSGRSSLFAVNASVEADSVSVLHSSMVSPLGGHSDSMHVGSVSRNSALVHMSESSLGRIPHFTLAFLNTNGSVPSFHGHVISVFPYAGVFLVLEVLGNVMVPVASGVVSVSGTGVVGSDVGIPDLLRADVGVEGTGGDGVVAVGLLGEGDDGEGEGGEGESHVDVEEVVVVKLIIRNEN
jgi:hypothetical protein